MSNPRHHRDPQPYITGTIRGFGPRDLTVSRSAGCVRLTIAGVGLQFDTATRAIPGTLAALDRLADLVDQARAHVAGTALIPDSDPAPPVTGAQVPAPAPRADLPVAGPASAGDTGRPYPVAPRIAGPMGAHPPAAEPAEPARSAPGTGDGEPGPAQAAGLARSVPDAGDVNAPAPLPAGLRCP